jgi:hypothetical protein
MIYIYILVYTLLRIIYNRVIYMISDLLFNVDLLFSVKYYYY